MERRKFLIGMGAVAAGGAAALGTGAFEGTYVAAERKMDVGIAGDAAAYLRLKDSSPYAEYRGGELVVDMDHLNQDADTRLDDVFRIQNSTGDSVDLRIEDGQDDGQSLDDYDDGPEDAFQVFVNENPADDYSEAVRVDSGNNIVTLGSGETVSVTLIAYLRSDSTPPSALPKQLLIIADGTS